MPDRLILAIETSNPASGGATSSAGVALAGWSDQGDVHPIDIEWLRTVGRHEDDLMPAVDRLCRRAGVKADRIARVAVSIGPGGYTGLRVAVTTANLLAAVSGADVVGIPTGEALALRATGPNPVGICLAVKGQSIWVHVVPGSGGGKLVRASEFASLGIQSLVADSFLPPATRNWAEAAGVGVQPPHYDPLAVAEIAASVASEGLVLPLYAREPEAVTRWRARNRSS